MNFFYFLLGCAASLLLLELAKEARRQWLLRREYRIKDGPWRVPSPPKAHEWPKPPSVVVYSLPHRKNPMPPSARICRTAQDGSEEWPGPNWAIAPDWANIWYCQNDGKAFWADNESLQMSIAGWVSFSASRVETAPSFDFKGGWREAMRYRPALPVAPPPTEP